MRFRLLRRRLTVSAPRMAVRSALPWPFRWAIAAIVLGFCAAIGLWAFEFGKDLAGLDKGSKEELTRLRAELSDTQTELTRIRDERDHAQSVANTAGTLVATEKASYEKIQAQVKLLEIENRTLRDDLGFFEKLIPAGATDGVAIRGLQADIQDAKTIKWQVLVIQPGRNVSEFNGQISLEFNGTSGGRPWSAKLSDGPLQIKMRQYGRMEGTFEIPPQVVVRAVTARVLDGAVVKATQSIKL
jgi:hypothetical protein